MTNEKTFFTKGGALAIEHLPGYATSYLSHKLSSFKIAKY